MKQGHLEFSQNGGSRGDGMGSASSDRFVGAMVFSAVGDALGWPTEFLKERPRHHPPFRLPLRDFTKWQKFVGGRWWGYRDDIEPGDYSDDTQLTLAVARCIDSSGDFQPERFAYLEFPLWLHYERGGGRSVKAAARSLIERGHDWSHNFFKRGDIDYRRAGANGAAMRTLPIALACAADSDRMVRHAFVNSIISHGHPRAIVGALLFGLAIGYVLREQGERTRSGLILHLRAHLDRAHQIMNADDRVGRWVENWNKEKPAVGEFWDAFAATCHEADEYIKAIPDFLSKPVIEYYRFTGALNPATKGSGVVTTCVALYLFLRHWHEAAEAVYTAVNVLGSDTDTIASFTGAFEGASHGIEAIPSALRAHVQDREYLVRIGNHLHAIAIGALEGEAAPVSSKTLDRQQASLRILAWEVGLHEMFWDAIGVDGVVLHPTLGRGVIVSKEVRPIQREGWAAKLIRVSFDCGQTCVFHSRVEHNERVAESLAETVAKTLEE